VMIEVACPFQAHQRKGAKSVNQDDGHEVIDFLGQSEAGPPAKGGAGKGASASQRSTGVVGEVRRYAPRMPSGCWPRPTFTSFGVKP